MNDVMNELINENMEIKNASYFFRNDETWGFGVHLLEKDGYPSPKPLIKSVEDMGTETREAVEKGECTADEIIKQTEKLCRLRKETKDNNERAWAETIIVGNISALTQMKHPITEGEYTGAIYTYGHKAY
jgi:hypothetical protein